MFYNGKADVRVRKTLGNLRRKEAGEEKPDERVDGVFPGWRFHLFESEEDEGYPEGYGCYNVSHRRECGKRRDSQDDAYEMARENEGM